MTKQIKNRFPKALSPGWLLLIMLFFILPFVTGAARIYGQKSAAPGANNSSAKPHEKPLPELKLPDLEGREWRLSEHRGCVVLMNFWATWCEPCRKEMPILVKLGKEYKSRGLEIVGINLDEEGDRLVKNFVAEFGIDYPVLLPVPGSLLARISPVPTTLLIDAEGRLAKKYVGAVPEKILRTDIVKLIRGLKTKEGADK